jgi:hypothetical protein
MNAPPECAANDRPEASMPRVGPGQPVCTGVWPITGNPCKNPPEAGFETCLAHDPAGDLRWPPPREEKRCIGTNKESGERCRKGHGPGGKVCEVHGGATDQNRLAAALRVAEGDLMALAADLVGTPVDNPLVELGKIAGRVRAWMEMLEGRVSALLVGETATREDEDDEGSAGHRDDIRYPHRAGEQMRAEVQLYERAMSQLGSLLTSIARLDIDRRLVQIEQDKVELVAKAVDAAIREAGLSGEQATVAKGAVVRHLRAAS